MFQILILLLLLFWIFVQNIYFFFLVVASFYFESLNVEEILPIFLIFNFSYNSIEIFTLSLNPYMTFENFRSFLQGTRF